jgi:hypothetical protein
VIFGWVGDGVEPMSGGQWGFLQLPGLQFDRRDLGQRDL